MGNSIKAEDEIVILSSKEFDELSLIRREYLFIFISPEEFLDFFEYEKHLNRSFGERVEHNEQTVMLYCHPSNIRFWDSLYKSADTPSRLPFYPEEIFWPEKIPSDVIQKEEKAVWSSAGVRTSVILVNWVDARRLRYRLLSFLAKEDDMIQVDTRSNSLIVTTDLDASKRIKAAARFLDDKRWYVRQNKSEK